MEEWWIELVHRMKKIFLWALEKKVSDSINNKQINTLFLPKVKLNKGLSITKKWIDNNFNILKKKELHYKHKK